MQDFEPAFHPAGRASAVLEQAARLALPGIVNTPGLADVYRAYGNRAVSFRPAVDGALYRPGGEREGDGPVRIFFYGRPSQPRNAFGLGLAVLREVKRRFGEGVQIVCAGEDWNPGQYGVADVLDNHGQLSDLEEVARLYGTCHIGLCFMLTPHPSYQPLEFMACGAATVSNRNPHTTWLLRHEENCLLAPALPSAVADQVARLVEDRDLRERIAAAGREQAAAATLGAGDRARVGGDDRSPGPVHARAGDRPRLIVFLDRSIHPVWRGQSFRFAAATGHAAVPPPAPGLPRRTRIRTRPGRE